MSELLISSLNRHLHIQPQIADVDRVYITTITDVEKRLLGFLPHKVISNTHFLLLDFLASIPYVIHYTLPVMVPVFLLLRRRPGLILDFYWLLGWVVWLSYCIQWVFPHAPPWFQDTLEQHQSLSTNSKLSEADVKIIQNNIEGCAFKRLDKFLGSTFFHNLYSGNPLTYGAFPSGHVEWPTIFYVTGGAPAGKWFLLYIVWITWATMYTCHHYLSDALGAIVCVIVTKEILSSLKPKMKSSLPLW